MLGNGITPNAFKSAVEQWIATNRVMPTSYDLTNLYNTSVLCYRAANFWADNVIAPKYVVHYDGEPVEDDDSRELPRLIYRPSFKRVLWRKNLTENFWGRDLVYIVTNWFQEPYDLHWVNPNMYGLYYSMEGLRPFWVYQSNRFEPLPASGLPTEDRRIPIEQSVYTHLFDFRNDYDGTAPAEVAFLQASANVEMAQTWNAMFKNLAIPAAIAQPPADDKTAKARDKGVVDQLINRLREVVQGSRNSGRTLVSPHRWDWITLQPPFKDMDFSTIDASIKEAVTMAFGVNIEFFTTGQTNYAELEGKIKLWRENTLKPRCEHYALEYTEQLAHPYFGKQWSIVADFSKILPENEGEKLANVRGKMDSLIITIGKAQELMGEEPNPLLADYFMVENIPVPTAALPTLWETRFAPQAPAAPFFGSMNMVQPLAGALPAPMQLETAAKDIDGEPLYVGLSLAGCADLVDKQRQVQAWCGDSAIQWLKPDEFHLTLLYVPRATPEQATALAAAVEQMDAPDFDLGIGGLRTFDSDDARGQYALHFRIGTNQDLIEYQSDLVAAATDAGIQPSAYSMDYKPHVTLGYAQQKPRSRRFGRDRVQPVALTVEHGERELLSVPLVETPDDVPPETTPPNAEAVNDLERWRTKAKRKGAKAAVAFESSAIPEPVQTYIREALRDNPEASGAFVNAVFTKAKEKLPPEEPEESQEPPATPEEYEAYWRRYDKLMREIGDIWLSDYMEKAYGKLAGQLSADTDGAQIRGVLSGLHDDVVSGWLGTMDKPGAMLEVMLGGMAAGNEALDGANPKPGKALDLNIDWELMSEEAYDFVQKYLYSLIRGIDRTTVERVQTVLRDWLKTGGSLDQLTAALEPVFKDKARASLIATTESTRAYYEGSSERWRQAGVAKTKWRTVQDAMVCPTCRALNGTIGTLTEGWKVGGAFYKPPAHPGCRCWGIPVLE